MLSEGRDGLPWEGKYKVVEMARTATVAWFRVSINPSIIKTGIEDISFVVSKRGCAGGTSSK
jgi:hypothetical protein